MLGFILFMPYYGSVHASSSWSHTKLRMLLLNTFTGDGIHVAVFFVVVLKILSLMKDFMRILSSPRK
jgi:hypothetical protein